MLHIPVVSVCHIYLLHIVVMSLWYFYAGRFKKNCFGGGSAYCSSNPSVHSNMTQRCGWRTFVVLHLCAIITARLEDAGGARRAT